MCVDLPPRWRENENVFVVNLVDPSALNSALYVALFFSSLSLAPLSRRKSSLTLADKVDDPNPAL